MFEMIPWRRRGIGRSPEGSAVDLWREMDSLFDRFFGENRWLEHPMTRTFAPALDISESEDELVVKAELPGVDPKEVDVNLTGNLLTIKGEKRDEREEKGSSFHRVERSFGSFSRSFQLPCDVEEEKIAATYKDGVLELRLPKTEKAKIKTRKIEVKQN